MKILYITQFFYPERTAGAIRAYENAINWVEDGNEVTVITTFPNYPIGKIYDGYKNKLFLAERIKGIKVYRNYLYIKPNNNIFNRMILYFGFPIFTLLNFFIFNRRYFKDKYDLMIATSGPVFVLFVGLIISKVKRIPFIVEYRDIQFKAVLATKFKNKLTYNILKKIELYFAKVADEVIVLTKGFKKCLIENGIDENRIDVIPNGFDVNKIKTMTGVKGKYIKNDDEILISYFGTMGVSQNLFIIMDLIKEFKDSNKLKFLFIGDGAVKPELIKYKRAHELDNVTILDSMPEMQLEYYYNISDYCLVSLNIDKNFAETIPSKIFQIMGRKKPIIFIGPEGEASEIINSAKCGLTLYDNDIEILKNKILNFIKKEDTQVLGNNGYKFVLQNYNRKSLCKKYIYIINEKVLGGKKH